MRAAIPHGRQASQANHFKRADGKGWTVSCSYILLNFSSYVENIMKFGYDDNVIVISLVRKFNHAGL